MDVKWIKLMVDMFDNRKIRYLRRLPEGNSIVLIWVMLLSLAGRCNAGGMIHLTQDIPYTPKMLADELEFEENTVVLALKALESLGMITQEPLSVTNWEEYQSTERLDQIREQNRLRKQKQRALETASRDSHVTVTQNVTQCHATEEEVEVEIEEEKERDSYSSPKNKKTRARDALSVFGEFAGEDHDLAVALADFAQMRKQIRKPLSEAAAKLAIRKLQEFRREEWIPILNQSVLNSWQWLFPLHEERRPAGVQKMIGGIQTHGAEMSPAMRAAVDRMMAEEE